MEVTYTKGHAPYILKHEGKTVGIDGVSQFGSIESLAKALEPRGLVIMSNMKVVKSSQADLPTLDEALEVAEEVAIEVTGLPEPIEVVGPIKLQPHQQKIVDDILAKNKKTKEAELTQPKKSGRPPTYTPEEAAERRRTQNRESAARARAAHPEKIAARAKKFREENQDKVEQYRKNSYTSRRQRLEQDPEYRAKYNEYQREYHKARRAAAKEA